MQRATGSRIQLVPYYSAESMFRGLLRGQIDFVCDRAANSVAMVRAGLIRAYAVTAKSRWSEMPDIPTTDEMGVPEIYVSYWHGLWAPKGTPDDIIAKLNAAAADAIADSGVRRRLSDQGMEVPPPEDQTPEALGAFQRAELSRYCDAMLTTVIAIIPTCSGRRAGFEAFVERRHTER
jgi:tripartite-type tricarboxylate transporter receptor subunit TctC